MFFAQTVVAESYNLDRWIPAMLPAIP